MSSSRASRPYREENDEFEEDDVPDVNLVAGLPAQWVTADEVYGVDPDLRAQLGTLQPGYVLCLGCNRRVTIHGARGGVRMRADQIAAGLGGHCWTRYPAGAGAKGPPFYEWAFVALHPDDGPGHRWLLIRRHPEHGELAYYRCYPPPPGAADRGGPRRQHPVRVDPFPRSAPAGVGGVDVLLVVR